MTLWFFALILAFAAGIATCLALFGTWWPAALFLVALVAAFVILLKRVPVQ